MLDPVRIREFFALHQQRIMYNKGNGIISGIKVMKLFPEKHNRKCRVG